MDLGKSTMTYVHSYIMQSIFTALTILCAFPIHTFIPQSLATIDLAAFIILSIPACNTVGITQYIAFSD